MSRITAHIEAGKSVPTQKEVSAQVNELKAELAEAQGQLSAKDQALVRLTTGLRDRLQILGNTAKNGRPREVMLESGAYGEMQRRVLDYAKSKVGKLEAMGWPGLTLKQSERRYYARNETIGLTKAEMGMTGHGLRAGFAEDMMLLNGVLPPVLGGTREMSNREDRRRHKLATSLALGHNRPTVTHAYYGKDESFAKAGTILGYRFGTPFALDGMPSSAVLWVSERPEPVDGVIGLYCLPGEKAELAYVTVQLVDGERETGRLSIAQFLKANPWGVGEIESRMNLLSLAIMTDEE